MLPELGNFILIMALGLTCLLSAMVLIHPKIAQVGHFTQKQLTLLAQQLTLGVFFLTLIAFLCLSYSFLVNDFSVHYVINHSNSRLPFYYRIAAVWSAHEGSLLLWSLLLSGWAAVFSLRRYSSLSPYSLSVLMFSGIINLGLLLILIFTSNPFARSLNWVPVDGRDLNPLLQDIGLIIHPPLLYMGYVGFALVFAQALAAMMTDNVNRRWARDCRSWGLASWLFLTVGMLLGAIWAYYELGWGGWWFWDPVENSSLMPWLTATALIHSLNVLEQRNGFKSWSILLAIATFSLCLLGTFLVRSGILVSVHAFASNAGRGMMILMYLFFVIGGSLLLYTLKANRLRRQHGHALLSKETLLLGNNLIFLSAVLVVLLGTLFPLIYRQVGLGSISVGAPFFNQMFTLLAIPIAFFVGITPTIKWQHDRPRIHFKRLIGVLLFTIVLAFLLPLWIVDHVVYNTVLGCGIALFILLFSLANLYFSLPEGISFWQQCGLLPLRFWAMTCSHLGLALFIWGVTFSHNHVVERHVRMGVGDTVNLADYQFTLDGLKRYEASNYDAITAQLRVHSPVLSAPITLQPEKRHYLISGSVMTEVAINTSLRRDLYAALGEQLDDSGNWSLRLYEKPFMSWIWLGGILIAFGIFLAMFSKVKVIRVRSCQHH